MHGKYFCVMYVTGNFRKSDIVQNAHGIYGEVGGGRRSWNTMLQKLLQTFIKGKLLFQNVCAMSCQQTINRRILSIQKDRHRSGFTSEHYMQKKNQEIIPLWKLFCLLFRKFFLFPWGYFQQNCYHDVLPQCSKMQRSSLQLHLE